MMQDTVVEKKLRPKINGEWRAHKVMKGAASLSVYLVFIGQIIQSSEKNLEIRFINDVSAQKTLMVHFSRIPPTII